MPNGSCDDLFASWLLAREKGEGRDIESLAAEHLDCAEALRAQHAELLRLESVLGLSSPPSKAAAGSDPDAPPEPELVLEPPSTGETETKPSPLLERLTQRGPPRGRFVVKERIGRGGMGAVFRVYDSEIGRHVAAKVLHLDDPAYLPRFLEEAQITGQLDHPAFIPVHDFALDEKGRVFFTMKLVKGITDEQTEEIRAETLSDVIEKIHAGIEDWTLTRGLDVILRVAEAMEFAHVKGVVHRDLKPANILVGRYGEVYVTDFGIARVQGRERFAASEPRSRSEGTRAENPERAIAAPTPLTLVRTERRDAIERGREAPPTTASPDSPGPTREGSTIGTPRYMPPEQADGRLAEIGPRSDVYSLGATLYHLIAGVPRLGSGTHSAEFRMLASRVPAELLAIVEKAMAVQSKDRYASMRDFAADLRAYLERRVVSAYETGAIAELKKWVQRNPYLTAAAVSLIVVLAGSSVVLSLKNKEIQIQKAAVDARNKEVETKNSEVTHQKNLVVARKAEFDQLAGKVYLERAIEREKELYPPWPSKINAMERWLSEDAKRLLDLKPTLESTLAGLRARALPWTDEERDRDRTTHPKFSEIESLRVQLASLRAAQAVRASGTPPVIRSLPAALDTKNAFELNEYAEPRVHHCEDPSCGVVRIFGEEIVALAAALAALEKIETGDGSIGLANTLDTVAWACFANGLDAEAETASERAVAAANEDDRADYGDLRDRVRRAIAAHTGESGAKLLSELEARVVAPETAVNARRTFTFALEAEAFLYATLSDLAASIASFESDAMADVERRLAWAKTIGDLTLRHPKARVSWDDARAAILKADDVVASKLYAQSPGGPIDLKPQMGLVPIGMNPVTKLWEFYELRSACDVAAHQDPSTLEIPTHREDGSIEVTDGMGIVFVLLPGGTFLQGAQKTDENAPNYDHSADFDERPQEVTLSPFFLARHELTSGQWKRLVGDEPSWQRYGATYDNDPTPTGWTHPVTQVDWPTSETWLRRHGLTLPTEARWEYGARGGTSTPWWTGIDAATLSGAANLLDRRAASEYPGWGQQMGDFDDGFVSLAPVGHFRGNAFGLFDVHGNVWEWCLDGDVHRYGRPRPGDGLRAAYAERTSNCVNRGGSFNSPASHARSASRDRDAPEMRNGALGVRPARGFDTGN